MSNEIERDFASGEFFRSLTELSEEVRQVMKTAESERESANELVLALKEFLDRASKSYKIDPTVFPRLSRDVESMILIPGGLLLISHKGGFEFSRPLEELSGKSLISIMKQILPKARTDCLERKESETDRLTELEQLAGRLKKVRLISESRP
ncbi:MAG: hypothetical protein OK439_00575 [Thaumarchaeota archaeon]|nr:hypothetical protein [Nitrososphaerota archaeon]